MEDRQVMEAGRVPFGRAGSACVHRETGVDRYVCVWLRAWARSHMCMQEEGRVGECARRRKDVVWLQCGA